MQHIRIVTSAERIVSHIKNINDMQDRARQCVINATQHLRARKDRKDTYNHLIQRQKY